MRLGTIGAAIFLAAVSSASSKAETITVKFEGVAPGVNVPIYYDANGSASPSARTLTTAAGAFNWSSLSSSNKAPFNGPFQTFCIDFDQSVMSPITFTLRNLTDAPVTSGPGAANGGESGTTMTDVQAEYLRELWGEHHAELLVGSASDRNIKSAAFQLAIWELLFESASSKDLAKTKGYFYVDSTSSSYTPIISLANNYVTSTLDAGWTVKANLIALTSANGQDHLAECPPVVPLPAAVWGGMALLGGLGVSRRLRRRETLA